MIKKCKHKKKIFIGVSTLTGKPTIDYKCRKCGKFIYMETEEKRKI